MCYNSLKDCFQKEAEHLKKTIILFLCVLLLALTGCTEGNKIPDNTAGISETKTDAEAQTPEPVPEASLPIGENEHIGSFYGSFLTMYKGRTSPDFPYAEIMRSYTEVEDYFYASEYDFIFGKRFTNTCASFAENFFDENDVMMLVISEPSIYVSHTADGIELNPDGICDIKITRHIPENAPLSSGIIYHLLFTAPKGGFDDIDPDKISVSLSEVIDLKNTDVFDAERFRYIYPEFWPFTHEANALIENASPTIASIQTYEELLGFYERNKSTFDLDKNFVRFIGSVYDEAMFEDYVLLLAVFPFDKANPKPKVSDLFVYNLQIYLTVENLADEIPSDRAKWYVLAVAVDKSSLSGVNLKEFNIG